MFRVDIHLSFKRLSNDGRGRLRQRWLDGRLDHRLLHRLRDSDRLGDGDLLLLVDLHLLRLLPRPLLRPSPPYKHPDPLYPLRLALDAPRQLPALQPHILVPAALHTVELRQNARELLVVDMQRGVRGRVRELRGRCRVVRVSGVVEGDPGGGHGDVLVRAGRRLEVQRRWNNELCLEVLKLRLQIRDALDRRPLRMIRTPRRLDLRGGVYFLA